MYKKHNGCTDCDRATRSQISLSIARSENHRMAATKPFHVKVEPPRVKVMGINVFPAMVKVYSLLSDEARKARITEEVGH